MDKNKMEELIKRLERLEKEVFGNEEMDGGQSMEKTSKPSFNFSQNPRAFAKHYLKGLSGPKQFALLLAFLTKGEMGVEVDASVIKEIWNTLSGKALLGRPYHSNTATRAKTNGWVDSLARGKFQLREEWEEISE